MVRHKSGGYYARMFLNGKEVWRSLRTKLFSVAEARLAEAQKEHRQRKGREGSETNGKMIFEQAVAIYLSRVEADTNLKRTTRLSYRNLLKSLLKSWPELAKMEVKRITPAKCRNWATGFTKIAYGIRYNNTIALLRHVLDVAKENGSIVLNPAEQLERQTVRPKILELPTLKQFSGFIEELRSGKSWASQVSADLVQGLAYTGCRISEAWWIKWQDLDFAHSEILVRGDPVERTKNGEIRRLPMIPAARSLFERMRKARPDESPEDRVFLVKDCQLSMDSAAKKTRMARITHHDLRHFFATICIESGVDIPTVSRWLGHKDGGALAMKTYGHLRREHSAAQALKVTFAPGAS